MAGRARLDRLRNEFIQMQAMHARGGLISVIAADGDPPEDYIIGYRCRGVEKIDTVGNPILREEHRLELALTPDFPRIRPMMRWMTPIFHPNFDLHGGICIVEWAPQETLCELCEVIGEMVQYKNYNTTSPLNIDAAMWAIHHRNELPIDHRYLFPQGPKPTTQLQPIARSIYQKSAVVLGTIPILPTSSHEQTGSNSGTPAIFCGNCGYKYINIQSLFCPQCGTKRVMVE